MEPPYSPPLALTIIAGIFLGIGALCLLIATVDIIWQRGWRTMMGVMIPVYIINAAYLGPFSLYLYYKYGRATKSTTSDRGVSTSKATKPCCHDGELEGSEQKDMESGSEHTTAVTPCTSNDDSQSKQQPSKSCCESSKSKQREPKSCCKSSTPSKCASEPHTMTATTPHCHSSTTTPRPFLITVLLGVSHCGAGCVLGDLIGDWITYTLPLPAHPHTDLYASLPLSYFFALLFGILFQYFSIAPMTGEYGPGTVWRAFKADVLSLTSFEVGCFGWMAIYQAGIWGGKLGMDTWVYWWMMQVGMVMGFATAVPMNWFLLKWRIKEPCC